MFQVSSGAWYNVGDDRMQDGDIIGEQAEVISDLGLGAIKFRDLTKYLLDGVENYRDRLKPVIIGKLLAQNAGDIERVYLVATNQNPEVRERGKDTIHSSELIQHWLAYNYPHIAVEIIHLGVDGTNPANFEQMFRWWRQTWQEKIQVKPHQPIWVCLKGGVGQASEASRISGLSLYGDRIQFFEFQQNTKANQAGIPSDYTGPFFGTNYLWNRAQQQALRLLQRYDYAGVLDLLDEPYFQKNPSAWGAVPTLVKAGLAWNQGQFETFFKLAKSYLIAAEQRQGSYWWWMAYEQAQLGVVRLEQQHTAEAMLHSFRAVEGSLWLWAKATFPNEVTAEPDQYPLLDKSILQQYPALSSYFDLPEKKHCEVELNGRLMRDLLEKAIPQTVTSLDFKAFGDTARIKRNALSHRLGGLSEKEVFKAWGGDIKDQAQWETRVLNCLNLITGQPFKSLSQASLFAKIHSKLEEAIASYHPN